VPEYVKMTVEQAEKQIGYIKNHIKEWDKWKKVERQAINDINSRISENCKEELGDLNNLKNIWDRLKILYVESTVGTWVKEMKTLWKFRGARKEGENPDDWMRKVIAKGRSAKENLGELTWDIFMGFILTVDLGDDLTTTSAETHRLKVWPTLDNLRNDISAEYHSKLNAGKTKPTASARPSNTDNDDAKLNLTLTGRKRKAESSQWSSNKRQDTENKKRDWLKCPLCNTKHPIKEEGQCYLAKPETAPPGWREKNKDRIEAFKKSR